MVYPSLATLEISWINLDFTSSRKPFDTSIPQTESGVLKCGHLDRVLQALVLPRGYIQPVSPCITRCDLWKDKMGHTLFISLLVQRRLPRLYPHGHPASFKYPFVFSSSHTPPTSVPSPTHSTWGHCALSSTIQNMVRSLFSRCLLIKGIHLDSKAKKLPYVATCKVCFEHTRCLSRSSG